MPVTTSPEFQLSQEHMAAEITAMERFLAAPPHQPDASWPPHLSSYTPDSAYAAPTRPYVDGPAVRQSPWREDYHPRSHGILHSPQPVRTARVASRPVPVISPDHPPIRRAQRPAPLTQPPASTQATRLKYDGSPSPWPNIERRPAAERNADGTPKLRAFIPAGHHEALKLDLETEVTAPKGPKRSQSTLERRPVPANNGDRYIGQRRAVEHRVRNFMGSVARSIGYTTLITADAIAANSLVQQHLIH